MSHSNETIIANQCSYYYTHPCEFIEKYYGIKLSNFQKLLIKAHQLKQNSKYKRGILNDK